MSKNEYETDPDDGLPREVVGDWVEEKHKLLCWYIDASRGARERLAGSPCLIDPFCGPGRVRLKNGNRSVRDGGAIAAVKASLNPPKGKPSPFIEAFIGDLEQANVDACSRRMADLGIPINCSVGKAENTIVDIAHRLPPKGLHIAYLDPYAIAQLPMSVIEQLSRVSNVDLMIHFASGDLRRNLEAPEQHARFESVAPGWKPPSGRFTRNELRRRFFEHWASLVRKYGYHLAAKPYRVRNSKKSEIYMLTLASKHPLGAKIWDSLRLNPQQDLW